MQGYCMKCRTKREIKEAKAYINSRAIINACKPYERIDNFAKSGDIASPFSHNLLESVEYYSYNDNGHNGNDNNS